MYNVFIQNNDLDYVERQPLLSGPPQTPTSPRGQKTYFARRPSQPKVPKGTDACGPQTLRTRPALHVFNKYRCFVDFLLSERVPLLVFGMLCIKQVRMSAILSGLKLEADLINVHGSATHRERLKGL